MWASAPRCGTTVLRKNVTRDCEVRAPRSRKNGKSGAPECWNQRFPAGVGPGAGRERAGGREYPC
jgi:hypothetical protein